MTIKSALAELTAPAANTAETVEKSFLASSRFLILIAFGVAIYFLKGVLTTELFLILGGLTALYIICNTVTRIYEIKAETTLRSERQRLAWTDGVLTAEEVEVVKAADEIAKGRPAVIKSPAAT